ncbi:16S rRNA (uracil1498-N3)-methyltransferase [Malonomonas rubra DSM 5091]|uniref:Ribosomal RNA small subunit methyltransferase E n=1 Tax=Malonomonas rubra DSM 5091 TaxID=1122189 RepID=A0A1M6KHK5_MALRU|nr:16S rRNA (uracil(1498)-N(3))-methyltransferase [Malonomonas rubra]SHJ58473.1 16S rRNA (uracil1498-N3)-methyltransferase [Malonomonas rubra DSM 5091]
MPDIPQLDQEVTLGREVVDALHCWRGRIGEIFTACDPQQQEYRVRIVALNDDSVTLLPFAEIPPSESPLRITLFQALPEKERFELVLQKATEIGVVRIVPYQSAKSSTMEERDSGQKKSHRWPNVLLRAARQCRRGEIPELSPVVDWQEALAECADAEMSLLCYEGEGAWPLSETINKFKGHRVAVMVGPEGGFTKEEIEQARAKGVQPVSLGPRILRTESAAILAAGIIQFAAGDLGR